MEIKDYTLLTVGLFLSFISIGQHPEKIYQEADQMPYFFGCEVYANGSNEKRNCSNDAVVTYVSNTLFYPEIARNAGIEGIVYISFVVDKNGIAKNPVVLRDIGGGCGEEAIRIVKNMPPWQPGLLRGKAVNVQLKIPIQFEISSIQKEASHTLVWDNLVEYEVTKQAIQQSLPSPIQVVDKKGVAISYATLIFSVNKKNKVVRTASSGAITPKMRKMVKKLKKGNLFSVVATIQKDGAFIEVDREFLLVRD